MKKRIFDFTSQSYEAPRAESVEVAQESILCASPSDDDLEGEPEGFTTTTGNWG